MFNKYSRMALAVLAVYRVSQMVSQEDGPMFIFDTLRRRLGELAAPSGTSSDDFRLSLAMLVRCPYCVGVWLAMLATIAVLLPNTVTDVVLVWLGLAGAQSYLEGQRR